MSEPSSSSPSVSRNVEKVARALFADELEQRAFLEAVARGDSGVTAAVWANGDPQHGFCAEGERPDWLPSWISVAAEHERPGKLPIHDEGKIYCMDLSSTFACSLMSAIKEPCEVVVDVCASPGGKGIVARRYLSPRLLVGNEVIGKRTAALISNYRRCSIDPSVVTSLDPEVLGREIPERAGLVVVDAPCSGQSLMLKGLAAPGAFHPATIGMNERRQRRILAHASKIVAPGGYLLYATCTFSTEENERNVEWFVKTFPDFSAVEVDELRGYRSHLSSIPSYRLWPQLGKGAGAFAALLRRSDAYSRSDIGNSEEVLTRLRTAWRSPTLFVSGPREETRQRPSKKRDKKPYKRERYRSRYE